MLLAKQKMVLVLLFGLVGCPSKPPVNTLKNSTLPELSEAMSLIRKSTKERKNLRALGRVTYFGKEGRVRAKSVFLAQRPGSFRVETLSPFEQPIDVMACDGDRIWFLTKETLYEGEATPENVSRMLSLPLKPSEVVDTLLGGVPSSSRIRPTQIEWEEQKWAITLKTGEGSGVRLIVDPKTYLVESLVLTLPGGDVRLSATFDDFEQIGRSGRFPLKIDLEMGEADVRIKLKEVEVNVDLPSSLFRLVPPPGVTPSAMQELRARPG